MTNPHHPLVDSFVDYLNNSGQYKKGSLIVFNAHLREVCASNGGPEEVLKMDLSDLKMGHGTMPTIRHRKNLARDFQAWDRAGRPRGEA